MICGTLIKLASKGENTNIVIAIIRIQGIPMALNFIQSNVHIILCLISKINFGSLNKIPIKTGNIVVYNTTGNRLKVLLASFSNHT